MSDDSRALAENFDYAVEDSTRSEARLAAVPSAPSIPEYLQDTYWWAYLHPKSFWFFEREWVVNLILWGNMRRLTDDVIDELDARPRSRILQVACVYGQFSSLLAGHLARNDSRLELLDVAPIQLQNARKKLADHHNVGYHHQDSSAMSFASGSFEETVVFFLLHEQPEEVRRETVAEAIRVTRPGGKIIFVDYHGPQRSNPMRYVMKPILTWLEPFAMDLWRDELPEYLPPHIDAEQVDSKFYFGGLYQKVVVRV
jgi:ubiquinone/menaquinone biosynthesis C-methylase UbiE